MIPQMKIKFNKKDLKFEYTQGKGPGGQHRSRTSSCVKITHIPTGITAMEDGRDQHHNKKMALLKLEARLQSLKEEQKAQAKKDYRDYKIHNSSIIRTYNYSRGTVKDHRSGKTASIKEVVGKGRIDLL